MRRPGGRLVLVVGPSGAGKDTLLSAVRDRLAAHSCYVFVRRVITRPPDRHEEHEPVSVAEFEERERRGDFALSWRAHGNCYAIPIEINARIGAGAIAICNASRTMIAAARQRYPSVQVIEITAPPDLLAERLARRGRETTTSQAERMSRRVVLDPTGSSDICINNSGAIEESVALFLAALGAPPDVSGENQA